MKSTLYSILGIDEKAPLQDIAAAYREHQKRLRHAGDRDAQNDMKLIQYAFEILSDPGQREQYDRSLKAEATPSNAIIYHPGETGCGGGGAIKLVVVSVLLIAGFMAFQHYSRLHTQAMASTGRMPAGSGTAGLPQVPVTRGIGPAPVGFGRQARQPPAASPPSSQPEAQQQPSPADVNDIEAVPLPVPPPQRGTYAAFRSRPSPRAFVICRDKRAMAYAGSQAFIKAGLDPA